MFMMKTFSMEQLRLVLPLWMVEQVERTDVWRKRIKTQKRQKTYKEANVVVWVGSLYLCLIGQETAPRNLKNLQVFSVDVVF